jgi:hypothetical protein
MITIVEFVVEDFFVFDSVPKNKTVVSGWEEHYLIGVNAEPSYGLFVFSKLFFEVPWLPVPKPDQSILVTHGNNMIINSLKTVDDTFGFFCLLSWLESVFINGYELAIKATC